MPASLAGPAFLFRLSVGNVKKSLRDFSVYFATLVLGVAIFYAFNAITDQADFLSPSTAGILGALGNALAVLTVLLTVVLGCLMVYANGYLVRRRRRELGLYQVLGMRRSQVCAVLTFETLLVSLASFAVGVVLGVVLSQVLVFATSALFQDRVTYFAFRFSPRAFAFTLGCFGVMYATMLLFNATLVGRMRLVRLLQGTRLNERAAVRSLPVAAELFVVALALIAVAYVRLLNDGLPITSLDGSGASSFALTTGLVSAGTVLLFYALSGFLLGCAQYLPNRYWRGLNMFTLRQLASRVNTVAFSMAVITMVLFLAMTVVTGGMSICTTINKNLKELNPYDASVQVYLYGGSDRVPRLPGASDPADTPSASVASGPPASVWADRLGDGSPSLVAAIPALLAQAGFDLGSQGSYAAVGLFDPWLLLGEEGDDATRIHAMSQATGVPVPAGLENSLSDTAGLDAVGIGEFNGLRALLGLEPLELGEHEYLVATDMGSDLAAFYTDVAAAGYTFDLGGRTLEPAASVVVDDASASFMGSVLGSNPGALVVPDAVASQAQPWVAYVNVLYDVPVEQGDAFMADLSRLDTADVLVDGDGERFGFVNNVITRTEMRASSAGGAGLISYLAIYIGFVLVIACAAILAIQQLSEASDAQGRYRLLAELGCPQELAFRSLLTQVLVYFAIPLLVALAHSFVALRVIVRYVAIFGALDVTGAALGCAGIFVVAYGGYFLLTYRAARAVVRQGMLAARRAT